MIFDGKGLPWNQSKRPPMESEGHQFIRSQPWMRNNRGSSSTFLLADDSLRTNDFKFLSQKAGDTKHNQLTWLQELSLWKLKSSAQNTLFLVSNTATVIEQQKYRCENYSNMTSGSSRSLSNGVNLVKFLNKVVLIQWTTHTSHTHIHHKVCYTKPNAAIIPFQSLW